MGDLRVRVRTEGGAEIASLRLDVGVPQVIFNASQGSATGSFLVELDPAKAPKTVDNFLAYVNQSGGCFYKDTLFHRVIKDFVVQAGGYTTGLAAKTTGKLPAIALESNNGLMNLRGAIAMARTADPNSATSEFFVNVKDNPDLDYQSNAKPGYAVFGKVIAGMEDIDRLQTVPTQEKTNGLGVTFKDAPQSEVVITTCGQVK
jgi:peptidyl-prolyl cis-trans isomerase A (cyclophilin A)